MVATISIDTPERLQVHRNNLRQKVLRARGGQVQLADDAVRGVRGVCRLRRRRLLGWRRLGAWAVAALDEYLTLAKRLEKADSLFNWRSDYAGSVIPEFLIRYSRALLASDGLSPVYTTRDSVVELTLTGGRRWLDHPPEESGLLPRP